MNPLQVKTEGIALAIQMMTGVKPFVQYKDGGKSELYFDSDGAQKLQTMLDDKITHALIPSKNPSDINLNFNPVVLPVLLKRLAPFAIGTLLAGYLIGRYS